jgi:secreted PhoX family phosphatase
LSLPVDRSRRRWLAQAGLAGVALATPMARLLAAAGARSRPVSGYGPLVATPDLNTGLPLLKVPRGFSYRTFGWIGEPLADGTRTPTAHDGMGIVAASEDTLTLVRNHEIVRTNGAFGPEPLHYDPVCGGGTVTLEIDAREGTLRKAWPSLSGTVQNCAGGVTPWGTWLSCEEYVADRGKDGRIEVDSSATQLSDLEREHGFVFEVDPAGTTPPVLLEGLGQFRHEAAVVHAPTGIVYLTEDRAPRAGFYRFVPDEPGKLAAGGRLQMLRAAGSRYLHLGVRVGQSWKTSWVDIEEPGRGHRRRRDGIGVLSQGLDGGGTAFTRLEGCWATEDAIYFTATNGGDNYAGQVWVYYPGDERISLLFESSGRDTMYYPDNICFSPRGGMVICEDGKRLGCRMWGLNARGELFELAQNNVRLAGSPFGLRGDFRSEEWAGACFSPDGKWLFANNYSPGFTVAITGPWKDDLV